MYSASIKCGIQTYREFLTCTVSKDLLAFRLKEEFLVNTYNPSTNHIVEALSAEALAARRLRRPVSPHAGHHLEARQRPTWIGYG